MPLYRPNDMLAVYQLTMDFVASVNDPSEYEEHRDDILRKFHRARENNRSLIERHPDIHDYLRILDSKEVKLASFSRRLKLNNNDDDLLRQKSELSEYFKEQETDGVEAKFGSHLYQG